MVTLVILLIIITPLSIADPGADSLSVEPQWGEELSEVDLGNLNGTGVIIAVADTGIDMDHSCFRDSETDVGEPGITHRKIVALND